MKLDVIGHTSVFVFKGVAQDVRDFGAKLGAGTVLNGTVRKSGDRLKVFTEMLDATTEEVLWAQTYERTLNDVFAVEAANRGGCSPSPADDVSPTDHACWRSGWSNAAGVKPSAASNLGA